MKIGIMQPYFFPYIGYFQLISAVDKFVVYDNIEFTKKGWINRNRILVNGADEYITLTLKKDSDYLQVKERFLADTWNMDRKKILNKLTENYRKAPFFNEVLPLVRQCILYENNNLFNFIFNSLEVVKEYLVIKTDLIVSSSIAIDDQIRGEDRVIKLCKELNAETYINPIGGVELYKHDTFKSQGINLGFLKANPIIYNQYENEFIPWLSILDVLFFNSKEKVQEYLNQYTIQ